MARETKRDVLMRLLKAADSLAKDAKDFPRREVAGLSKEERKALAAAGNLFSAIGHALWLRGSMPTTAEIRARRLQKKERDIGGRSRNARSPKAA